MSRWISQLELKLLTIVPTNHSIQVQRAQKTLKAQHQKAPLDDRRIPDESPRTYQ